jgi:hypothetical protein
MVEKGAEKKGMERVSTAAKSSATGHRIKARMGHLLELFVILQIIIRYRKIVVKHIFRKEIHHKLPKSATMEIDEPSVIP